MPTLRTDRLVPRNLHPGAWWLWAIGLTAVASRSRNPLLLLLVLAVAGYVVSARRSDAPWARAFTVFLKIGLVVIVIRTVAQVVLGNPIDGQVLFTLPELPLPDWAAGVTFGGPVTAPSVAAAVTDGLRLATVLACIGAANALANPKRLLAAMPAALYEIGVALVVALSFAPSLVTSVQRIRAARRLRGRPDRGVRGMITVAMPVLEDALERSLALAAAMDSRGYGRRAEVPATTRRTTSMLLLGGLIGISLGVYGLLDATGPAWLGIPVLLLGVVMATGGLALAGRRAVRSRYRPDPWSVPEWLTTAAGAAAVSGVAVTGLRDAAALNPDLLPLMGLPLPVAAALGILVAAVPAWVTPRPPRTTPTSPPDPRPAATSTLTQSIDEPDRTTPVTT
ncbi:MAG: energy-coupling factor transporter transmembrane protein EcfT [Nitriliruptor sp.]|nr:MAG: energy-coupling factor transporter transmembrane protein EcfT [Nitriliruptor sp.]